MMAVRVRGLLGLSLAFILASTGLAQVDPFSAGIQTYDLTMPAAIWEQLQIDARDEEWARAQISIAGTPVEGDIGIRFKGAVSTLALCFVDDVWDREECPRLSLKLGFTKYDGEPYAGVYKKLNLHSMSRDPTKLAERITYELYNKAGIPTARSSWAMVTMNGDPLGLFSLVEQIDDVFIRRIESEMTGSESTSASDQDIGQLYKETWIGEFGGSDYFEDGLKEGGNDHTPILELQDDLTSAAKGCRLPVLASAFNVTSLFTQLAINAVTNDWDSLTAFYCTNQTGPCSPHNFYVYRSLANEFSIIPWDMDLTLDASNLNFDEVNFWLSPGNCTDRVEVFGDGSGFWAKSAGCSPLFAALAENPPAFTSALETFLAGEFTFVEDRIRQYQSEISDFVDPEEFSDWTAAVERMVAGLPLLIEKARSYTTSAPPAVCDAGSGPTAQLGFEVELESEMSAEPSVADD